MLILVLERRYIDLLIAQKLIDVRALIARIEAKDETKCEIIGEIRGEASSTSLESKKKNEVCKIKNPQINNEGIEKILIQLVGTVMEVGYLLNVQLWFLFSLVLLF